MNTVKFTQLMESTPDGLRFIAKVSVRGSDECWLWNAGKNENGYGRFWHDDIAKMAHRYSHERCTGEIPIDFEIDHLCKNPSCVNPSHLEAVTKLENIRRSDVGIYNLRKTHCNYGHPYSGYNLYIRPDRIHRECRQCRNRLKREARARKRELV